MAHPNQNTPSGTKVKYREHTCTLVQVEDVGKDPWPSLPRSDYTLKGIEAFILGYPHATGYKPYWLTWYYELTIIEDKKEKEMKKTAPLMFIFPKKKAEHLNKLTSALCEYGIATVRANRTIWTIREEDAEDAQLALILNPDGELTWRAAPEKVSDYDGYIIIYCNEVRAPREKILVASHEVTDLTDKTAKVGCTKITYEEVCKLKEAMEKAGK